MALETPKTISFYLHFRVILMYFQDVNTAIFKCGSNATVKPYSIITNITNEFSYFCSECLALSSRKEMNGPKVKSHVFSRINALTEEKPKHILCIFIHNYYLHSILPCSDTKYCFRGWPHRGRNEFRMNVYVGGVDFI